MAPKQVDGTKSLSTKPLVGVKDDVDLPEANFSAIRSVAGLLVSTLGPMSKDKLIVQQLEARQDADPSKSPPVDEFVTANDGARILQNISFDHPVAPLLQRIVGPERKGDTDVEGLDIPDGTTSTVVLLASLLDEAQTLLEKGVHPTDIQKGYAKSLDVARETLHNVSFSADSHSDSRFVTTAVARTAMTGNDIFGAKDEWAKTAVEAVDTVGKPTPSTLSVRRIGDGSISKSQLVTGAVLDRNSVCHEDMPRSVTDANVLVLGGFDEGGLQDADLKRSATVQPSDLDTIAEMDSLQQRKKEQFVERLHEYGVDVVFARQGMTSEHRQLLAEHDIMGVRRVNRIDLKQVARATGAFIVTAPSDVTPSDLGWAGTVEETLREPRRHRRRSRKMVLVDDCQSPDAVSMVLYGVFDQLAEQAATEFRKGAASVAIVTGETESHPGVVPGGGAADIQVADAVRDVKNQESSRTQVVMEGFANAVKRLVFVLSKNCGMDPITTVSDIRAAHHRGEETVGIVQPAGRLGETVSSGVLDPMAIRKQVYTTAIEVSNQLVRIDGMADANFTTSTADPEDTIYDDVAEKHADSGE